MNTIKPGMRGVAGTREYNRCNIALSTVFLTTILVASALAQGSGYIYWVDKVSAFSTTNTIRRADLDGTNDLTVNIPGGVNLPSSVAPDLINNHIYWTEANTVPGGGSPARQLRRY